MTSVIDAGTEQGLFFHVLRSTIESLDPKSRLDETLGALLRNMAEEIGYTRAFLAIVDPVADNLRLSISYSPEKTAEAVYEPGVGVVGQVFETGRPIVVPRLSEHPAFLNKAFGRTPNELQALGFICVPIVAPGRDGDDEEHPEILGTLSVDIDSKPSELLESHLRFLEVVASLIATHVARLQEELVLQNQLLSQGMSSQVLDAPPPPNFVAASKSIRMVLRQARQVGPSRATVLLRGESGTGKELLAEAIHQASPRKDQPLIKLNCAALPSELVESELFGHQKGAFTGAIQTKKGLFEVAHGGTLFLDEIGELSLDAQAKVLRAIQEKEIQRVGSERPILVDVRLICATHRPLEELLEQSLFREDLFYRINVFPIFIPSLRERKEDILPLAEHFLQDFSKEYNTSVKRISTPAIDCLVLYHWPGNVRELRNCMERAVLVCEDEVIRTYHLPPTLQTAESSATDTHLSFGEAVAKFEQELLCDALKKSRGNMLQAARDLRVSYRILNYKVRKFHIDLKKFTPGGKKKKRVLA